MSDPKVVQYDYWREYVLRSDYARLAGELERVDKMYLDAEKQRSAADLACVDIAAERDSLRAENAKLRERLAKYESTDLWSPW